MKIIVGSKNPNKVEAVRDLTTEYPVWHDAEVLGLAADSGVTDQPMTLEETMRGAINRARNAYAAGGAAVGDMAVGLESGLMPAPFTKSGFFEVCVCAIFDGAAVHLGLSNGFEHPPKLIAHLLAHGGVINTVVATIGFDARERMVGYAQGMIGLLTHGRVPRKEMSTIAVRMALIHLENAEWYS